MIVLLFLCIKLSIIHLCVADFEYVECERENLSIDPEIFLIDSYESKTKHLREILNSEFKAFCGDYYNIRTGSLEEAKEKGQNNIIHFAFPNYDGKPLENFEYAGNVNKTDDTVCTKDKDNKFYCNETANLVSPSVRDINHGHVYDIVQEMQLISNNGTLSVKHRDSCEPHYEKTSDLTIVLLCNIEKQVFFNRLPLSLKQIPDDDDECRDYLNKTLKYPHLNRLLAVLAPKPFLLPYEYSVPTIFYEAPYLYSEDKAGFPNSMNLVPWRLLKFGYLKFIQKFGWQRVAIVTDDSEYSLEFEDELTALFSKEGLVYTVIRCEDAECHMYKIIQQLRKIPARIVIANVDEKHAEDLLQGPNKITWLLRDMAGKGFSQKKAFSFSIHSTTNDDDVGCRDMKDNILTSLDSIGQAYISLTNKDIKKREFYSLFAKTVKQKIPKIAEAKILVKNLVSQTVASMYVNENGAEITYFDDPYVTGGTVKPTDGTAHCLMSSYNYFEPCEDPMVMLLMFVLMMFVLTILLITCFFDKTSPFNDIRYQNF